jgi:hypothetical protein
MTRVATCFALASLSFSLIVACTDTLAANPSPPWPILPGHGVGPLHLGMTDEQAKPYLSAARFAATKRLGSFGVYEWATQGLLSFRFEKMHDESSFHLTLIVVEDPSFVTVQGVHVGSLISRVMSAYGTSSSTMITKEQEQGQEINANAPNALVQCLDTTAEFADNGAAVQFFFSYLKQGIVFITRSTPNSSSTVDMSVAEIRILAPQPCRRFGSAGVSPLRARGRGNSRYVDDLLSIIGIHGAFGPFLGRFSRQDADVAVAQARRLAKP